MTTLQIIEANTIKYLKNENIELVNQTPLQWLIKLITETPSIIYQSKNEEYVADILNQILEVSEVSVSSFDKWRKIKIRNRKKSFLIQLEDDWNIRILVEKLESITPKDYLVIVSNCDNTSLEYNKVASPTEALNWANLDKSNEQYPEFIKNFGLGENLFDDGAINVTLIDIR